MRLTRRGRVVAFIAATLAALLLGAIVSLDVDAAPVHGERPTAPLAKRCDDRLALLLTRAGFRGQALRTAWAVVQRESNGQNLIPGHPSYNGADVGIWQVNRPAWGGSRWWSEAAMGDPARQSRIVYRILTKRGTYWRPWGLTRDGRLDATHYGSWSAWQHENWIMAPFRKYAAQFDRLPRACRVS